MESLASAFSSVNRLRGQTSKRRISQQLTEQEESGPEGTRTRDTPQDHDEPPSAKGIRTRDAPQDHDEPPSAEERPAYRFGYKEFEGTQGLRLLKGILHNVLPGAKYQFWWSVTEFQARNQRAYVGVRKLAEYMGRSERTIRNHLNDLLAQGLMVIEQTWVVRARTDGSFQASRVRCKDFDPLYDIAYAYLCWMKSPEYIPPEWDYAEFFKHHERIRERVKSFAAYQKYLVNKKPGPSSRKTSERSPIRCDDASCAYCYPEIEVLLTDLRSEVRNVLNANNASDELKREIRVLWNKHLQEYPPNNRNITESNITNSNSNSKFESIKKLANALIRFERSDTGPHTSSPEGDSTFDSVAAHPTSDQPSSESTSRETGPKQTSKREASEHLEPQEANERVEHVRSRLTAREANLTQTSKPVESEWSGEMEANQPEQQPSTPGEITPEQSSKHFEHETNQPGDITSPEADSKVEQGEACRWNEQVEANRLTKGTGTSQERVAGDIDARIEQALNQLAAREAALEQASKHVEHAPGVISSRQETLRRIEQALSRLEGMETDLEQSLKRNESRWRGLQASMLNEPGGTDEPEEPKPSRGEAGCAKRPPEERAPRLHSMRDSYRPLELGPLLQDELDRRAQARQAWRNRYQCKAQSLPDIETRSRMTPREPLSHRLMMLGYAVSERLNDSAPYSTQTMLVNHLKRLLHFASEAGIERYEEIAEQWLFNMVERCLEVTCRQESLRARTEQGLVKHIPWFITALKNSVFDACKALTRGEQPPDLTQVAREAQSPANTPQEPDASAPGCEEVSDGLPQPEESTELSGEAKRLMELITALEGTKEPSAELEECVVPLPPPVIVDPDKERFPTPLRLKLRRRLIKAGIQEPIEYLGPGCPECGCHFRYVEKMDDGQESLFCCRCQPAPTWSDELYQQVIALLDTPPDEIRTWHWLT